MSQMGNSISALRTLARLASRLVCHLQDGIAVWAVELDHDLSPPLSEVM